MKQITDLLIIIPPAKMQHELWAPLGAMYIGSALRQKGYTAKILNVDIEKLSDDEVINRIKDINPHYIGYSGMVATCYKYVKNLSYKLKANFPNKIQILGGGLSCAAEVVLQHSAIDIVVLGEGDITIIELMEALEKNRNLRGVRGIYFKEKTNYIFTGKRPLILDLDTIPFPAFDLVDMDKYLPDGMSMIRPFTNMRFDENFYTKTRKKKMINIITSRGCIGSCGFCARPDAGYRRHSLKYIFDLIDYCKEKFNVGFFSFGDECFAPSKVKNWEFINEYKKRKPDIIFRIAGLRVDSVDEDIIRAYKEIGCVMINFGFESGSQRMLNIIDKRVTVEQNRQASLWVNRAGIYTPPQLILGMPGETGRTIQETIDFLKTLEPCEKQYKFTYALPFPGSELYKYAQLIGAIEDEDKYLTSICEIQGTQTFHINLTDEPDETVDSWRQKIDKETFDHYFYKKYKVKNKLMKLLIHFVESLELHLRRKDLLSAILRKLRLILYSIFNKKAKKEIVLYRHSLFRKKRNIKIEDFLKGKVADSLNSEVSLKRINSLVEKSEMQEALR